MILQRNVLAMILGAASLAAACSNAATKVPVAEGGTAGVDGDADIADAGPTEAGTSACPPGPQTGSLPVLECPPAAPADGSSCCGRQRVVCSYDCSGTSLLDQSLIGGVASCFPTEAGCIPVLQTVAATCGDNELYQVDVHGCHPSAESGAPVSDASGGSKSD